jgi:hypothetical protein
MDVRRSGCGVTAEAIRLRPTEPFPASTVVEVPRLLDRDRLLEVSAIAVLAG